MLSELLQQGHHILQVLGSHFSRDQNIVDVTDYTWHALEDHIHVFRKIAGAEAMQKGNLV